jgi:Uma2 family endonuclease
MSAPHAAPLRPATYQDVLDAPPQMVAQIVGGALHLHARPAYRHGRAHFVLGRVLGGPFDIDPDGPGGWLMTTEPELHLGGDVLVPDLAGWRRERLPEVADDADPPWFDVAPDWACEVLSPCTRKLDLTGKREAYAREGVAHLWLIDPPARTLEAFVLRDGAWTLLAALKDDDPVRLAPFDAIEFPLAALWRD